MTYQINDATEVRIWDLDAGQFFQFAGEVWLATKRYYDDDDPNNERRLCVNIVTGECIGFNESRVGIKLAQAAPLKLVRA